MSVTTASGDDKEVLLVDDDDVLDAPRAVVVVPLSLGGPGVLEPPRAAVVPRGVAGSDVAPVVVRCAVVGDCVDACWVSQS